MKFHTTFSVAQHLNDIKNACFLIASLQLDQPHRISAAKLHLSGLQHAYRMPHCAIDTEPFRKQMSDTQTVVITVNGQAKRYSPEFQTSPEYEKSWQKVLKDAYGHAEVRCMCRGIGPKRLAVKYYEFADAYSLAKFSLSGPEHAADCQYYSVGGALAGPNGRGAGVLDVQPDGSVKIRLEIGFAVRDTTSDVATPADVNKPNRPGSTCQSAIKLAGLLHYLWDAATLNQWRRHWAGKRNFRQVFWRIDQAADDVHPGNLKLGDQLLLPAMAQDSSEAERNRLRVESALQGKRRMRLIAPLASYSPEREQRMAKDLAIRRLPRHTQSLRTAWPVGAAEQTIRSGRRALEGWSDCGGACTDRGQGT